MLNAMAPRANEFEGKVDLSFLNQAAPGKLPLNQGKLAVKRHCRYLWKTRRFQNFHRQLQRFNKDTNILVPTPELSPLAPMLPVVNGNTNDTLSCTTSTSDWYYLYNNKLRSTTVPKKAFTGIGTTQDDDGKEEQMCNEHSWLRNPSPPTGHLNRGMEICHGKIRLGDVPTNFRLSRSYPNLFPSDLCSITSCTNNTYIDTAHHRIFICPRYQNNRKKAVKKLRGLLQSLGKKLGCPTLCDLDHKMVTENWFNWDLFLCLWPKHLPTTLCNHLYNDKDNAATFWKSILNIFSSFLIRSGLYNTFMSRIRDVVAREKKKNRVFDDMG
jgi:hypothetical protein